jgi:hypothetical protein
MLAMIAFTNDKHLGLIDLVQRGTGGVYSGRHRLRSLKCHQPTSTELFSVVSVRAGFSLAIQGFLSVRISINTTCSEPVKFWHMHHISQK